MVHRCVWRPAIPWLLALSAACSRATDGNPRASHVVPDGGAPQKDGGPSTMDGRAPRTDAGAPRTDAGAPRMDSGAPRTDSGSPPSGADASSGTITICANANLPQLAKGTCSVSAGGPGTLVTGTILTPTGVLRGGQVFFDSSGAIQCVDCDCTASAKGATGLVCPTGVVSPGLINAHDHITYTQNSPYTDTGERYEHRHDWRDGLNGHTPISVTGGATPDEIHWGELRFLLGGATSTVGSGGATGLLRNLDKAAFLEGLNQTPVDFNTFPLGDANGTELAQGCGYPNVVADVQIAADDAFLPHVAEGIGAFAENEFSCLSEKNPGHDVVMGKSAFIHAVGLTAADYADMAKNGTALVWSPRSNLTLYGDTSRVAVAARLGVSLALGTDWISTGSMNLLRELKCADSFNGKYLGGFFTDRDLWLMVTAGAASATATDDVIGSLVPGKVADLTIFDGRQHPDYRAVLDANPEDVVFVARAGKGLYGDASIVTALRGSGTCDLLDVCGVSKEVCLADEIGETLPVLQSAVGSIYAAFFCGTPLNEPICIPERPTAQQGSTIYTGTPTTDDLDGDGVPNGLDDCPKVFNPIRPMDSGVQPDADADGVGDACDPCPFAANTSSCQ